MEGNTFECPLPRIKPAQCPFGHVAVEVLCGGGRTGTGSVEVRSIGPWGGRNNKEAGR